MPLKPAAYYGNVLAVKAKCPPGSSQAKYYADIAEMVALMLADATVTVTVSPGVLPTGLSVLVMGVPTPVTGVGTGTGGIT